MQCRSARAWVGMCVCVLVCVSVCVCGGGGGGAWLGGEWRHGVGEGPWSFDLSRLHGGMPAPPPSSPLPPHTCIAAPPLFGCLPAGIPEPLLLSSLVLPSPHHVREVLAALEGAGVVRWRTARRAPSPLSMLAACFGEAFGDGQGEEKGGGGVGVVAEGRGGGEGGGCADGVTGGGEEGGNGSAAAAAQKHCFPVLARWHCMGGILPHAVRLPQDSQV
jgi:hypothetical protein